MSDKGVTKILIVAYRTAAAPPLLEAVRQRAKRGPCAFTLVVPQVRGASEQDAEEAEHTLELAIPHLEEAAGGHVEGIVGDSDPVVAARETMRQDKYDEVIVSTLPERVSRWLRRDVPHRIEQLGAPVTTVTAPESAREVRHIAPPVHGWGHMRL